MTPRNHDPDALTAITTPRLDVDASDPSEHASRPPVVGPWITRNPAQVGDVAISTDNPLTCPRSIPADLPVSGEHRSHTQEDCGR